MNIVVIGRGNVGGGLAWVLVAAVKDGAPVFCRLAVPGEL
jgi:hypothetical protein